MPARSFLSSVTRPLRVLVGVASMGAAIAFAQSPPPLSAPEVAWRAPVLRVEGAEQPVRIESLRVDVEVAGGAAATTVQMVFFNPNQRILEGKLQFPLAPGQVVAGFALDVDGKLRAAVPVEKARAQQVFEDIARRRVDPGLLQTTIGNNYELRIYPLLPGRTRTVELRIVEPAPSRLRIPLAYAERVRQFAVALRVPGATIAPELSAPAALGLRFERDPAGGFVARSLRDDAVLPKEPVVLKLATASQGAAVATAEFAGERYFTLELPVSQRTAPRPLPQSVQIVWDASGSGAHRRIDRELALLDSYFAAVRDTSVTLVRVADVAAPQVRFEVRGGDWSALRRALETTVYDGASNLGAVRHDGVSREALWFSDGLANYGAPWRLAFPVPVYAISSADSSDPAALQALADATGGRSIDLATMTREAAISALLRRGSELAGLSALGARELVAQSQSAAAGRLVVAGVLTARRCGSHAARARRERRDDDPRRAGPGRPQPLAARSAAVGAPDARVARRRGAHEQGPDPRDRQALRPGDARDLAPRPRAGRRLRAQRDRAARRAARRLRPDRGEQREASCRERRRRASPRSCAASRRASPGGTATSRKATCRRRWRSPRRKRRARTPPASWFRPRSERRQRMDVLRDTSSNDRAAARVPSAMAAAAAPPRWRSRSPRRRRPRRQRLVRRRSATPTKSRRHRSRSPSRRRRTPAPRSSA